MLASRANESRKRLMTGGGPQRGPAGFVGQLRVACEQDPEISRARLGSFTAANAGNYAAAIEIPVALSGEVKAGTVLGRAV
jgi:hypothetical protein